MAADTQSPQDLPGWLRPMDVAKIKEEIQEGRQIVAFIKTGGLQSV